MFNSILHQCLTHLTSMFNSSYSKRSRGFSNSQNVVGDYGCRGNFGLSEEGLFEGVTKGTCVVFGKKGARNKNVRILTCTTPIANIDLDQLPTVLHVECNSTAFKSLIPGNEGITQTIKQLDDEIIDGWRKTNREHFEAIGFIDKYITPSKRLQPLSSISTERIKRKRGPAGNTGASDLIFLDRNGELYNKYSSLATVTAIRNAKIDSVFIGAGDSAFFNIEKLCNDEILNIVEEFSQIPIRISVQQRTKKTPSDLIRILERESLKKFPCDSVLIPRGIRSKGKIYISESDVIVSTNFV
jgi:hypothetical protein